LAIDGTVPVSSVEEFGFSAISLQARWSGASLNTRLQARAALK